MTYYLNKNVLQNVNNLKYKFLKLYVFLTELEWNLIKRL